MYDLHRLNNILKWKLEKHLLFMIIRIEIWKKNKMNMIIVILSYKYVHKTLYDSFFTWLTFYFVYIIYSLNYSYYFILFQ